MRYLSSNIIYHGVMGAGLCRSLTMCLGSARHIGKFTKKPPWTHTKFWYIFFYALEGGRRRWESGQGMNLSTHKGYIMHFWVMKKTEVQHTNPERTQGRWIYYKIYLMVLITAWCTSIPLSFGFVETKMWNVPSQTDPNSDDSIWALMKTDTELYVSTCCIPG